MKRVIGDAAIGYPPQPTASYSMADVDQLQAMRLADVLPTDGGSLEMFARAVALDAVLYGLPGVFQYAHLFAQAIQTTNPAWTGFNMFHHDRELAGPGYEAFLTPNADTLYSNAWLDLTHGPILIDVPEFGGRYYTLNFLDMYSNATNISTITAGGDAGRYLVAAPDWDGPVPSDVTVFRVATGYMWILMRIFVDGPDDLAAGRELQDAVQIIPGDGYRRPDPARFPPADPHQVRTDWVSYFRVLDFLLRNVAHPHQEDALVYRYQSLGIGGKTPWRVDELQPALRDGMAHGFQDAMRVIDATRSTLGVPLGKSGWSRGYPAAYGFNYLRRAATNFVGLGATVRQENQAFMCWRSGDGTFLDGAQHAYHLRFDRPPPVDAFWSLSAYDATTYEFSPNAIDRYVISDRTPGIRWNADGSLIISIQHRQPSDPANWLPVPDGPFYLAIRAYAPRKELLDGAWAPNPVQRHPTHAAPSHQAHNSEGITS
jgi:hypothetical protein